MNCSGSRIGSAGVDHDGVAHGVIFFQDAHNLGNLALLLADGNVDADEVAAALVDNGVQRNGRLARRAVADDQLPLAPANGNHGVNGLDSGLHRRIHRLADHHVGSHLLHRPGARGADGALAVQGTAQGVNNPPDQRVTHRNLNNLAGRTDPVTLFDCVGIAQNGGAHNVGLQVQGQAQDVVAKIQQLVGAHTLQTLDAGDTVTHLDHGTYVHQAQITAKFLDLTTDKRNNFLTPDRHGGLSLIPNVRGKGRCATDRPANPSWIRLPGPGFA